MLNLPKKVPLYSSWHAGDPDSALASAWRKAVVQGLGVSNSEVTSCHLREVSTKTMDLGPSQICWKWYAPPSQLTFWTWKYPRKEKEKHRPKPPFFGFHVIFWGCNCVEKNPYGKPVWASNFWDTLNKNILGENQPTWHWPNWRVWFIIDSLCCEL